jgi:hypothetical protein
MAQRTEGEDPDLDISFFTGSNDITVELIIMCDEARKNE